MSNVARTGTLMATWLVYWNVINLGVMLFPAQTQYQWVDNQLWKGVILIQ